MKTKQLYLKNAYLQQMTAQVLEVVQESSDRYRILLDKTVFYAMGGGQPTDQGVLTNEDWSAKVYQVSMKDGELWHFISAQVPPQVGAHITGKINWDRRYKNMRKHSAGHVIDFALYQLELSPTQLQPVKGDHGKKAHIVYKGVVDDDIRELLQQAVDAIVAQDLEFSCAFVTYDELQKDALYLQPNLPTHKPLRALTLEGIGTVADGGTQVAKTGEVGRIVITTIEADGEYTHIAYTLDQ